jgi:1-acyl-sn-glycerol-3-phosphate acyltransferase
MPYDVDSIHNRDAELVGRVADVLSPILSRLFQPVVRGTERIPPGSGLYVANHNGGLLFPDAYAVAEAIYRTRGIADMPYVLAHDLVVRFPLTNAIFPRLGALRACAKNARRVFEADRKVLVFPGGDIEVMRPFRDRDKIVFGARRGYMKLAITEGVPVIPVVTAGAHSGLIVLDDGGRVARFLGLDRAFRIKVFPTVISIPWGLTVGFPPPYLPYPTRFYTEFLEPIRFERSGNEAADDADYVEACHQRVVDAMQAALTRLAKERYVEKRARHMQRLTRVGRALGLSESEQNRVERLLTWIGITPFAEAESVESRAHVIARAKELGNAGNDDDASSELGALARQRPSESHFIREN